jgi:glutathione synthase/RimK-type ligase-like ATP-grasp enzyme
MPNLLVVVDNLKTWPVNFPGAEVVSAKSYLTDERYKTLHNAKVFNLCSSYRYQTKGYYVSLLAAARQHKPTPDAMKIQDTKSPTIMRYVSDELDEMIQKSLKTIKSRHFQLSVYFGRNIAKRYDRLGSHLFKLFQTPLLRASFVKHEKWVLQNIEPMAGADVPEHHRDFLLSVATEFFGKKRLNVSPKPSTHRYDLAILVDPNEKMKPSDDRALKNFTRAAEHLGFATEFITRDDYARIAEFDALFLRETTSVNHHTYRFARRAAAEGLVVVDDPESILRCTNKVYLTELLENKNIRIPKTLVIHRGNVEQVAREIGFPCILKQPDSSFSQGVTKASNLEELMFKVEKLMDHSELILAQEYMPTEFDWRVGVFDRKPLYVCKYFMAPNHWQIIKKDKGGRDRFGDVETMPIEEAPAHVIQTALRAANLIGDSLYGVDIKELNGKSYVIEVNDNPNIDAGTEDAVLKERLYDDMMNVFLRRIEAKKRA